MPCRRWFTVQDNGLVLGWDGDFVWCNPPYERLAPWVNKAINEHKADRAKRIVMLIPNRPGTKYWRAIVKSGLPFSLWMVDYISEVRRIPLPSRAPC